MSHWETIRRFDTERFSVILDCEPEQCPDTSWMEAEDLAKLESGEWINVTFRVRVLCDGLEVGSDYLGNSVYADVTKFAREHIGARGQYGSYFTDMVTAAVTEARKTLSHMPRVRKTA